MGSRQIDVASSLLREGENSMRSLKGGPLELRSGNSKRSHIFLRVSTVFLPALQCHHGFLSASFAASGTLHMEATSLAVWKEAKEPGGGGSESSSSFGSAARTW